MNEEWRMLPGDLYEVSNRGNVRRAAYGINTHVGRVLKPGRSSNGYLIFGYHSGDGSRITMLVHRAVAVAFLGPIPEGHEVNHKDGIKLNNRADNLEYVTVSGNAVHAYKTGLNQLPTERARGDSHWTKTKPEQLARGDRNGAKTKPESTLRGSSVPSSKLQDQDVLAIRQLSADGIGMQSIAEQFGISRRNVQYIVTGKSWRHLL